MTDPLPIPEGQIRLLNPVREHFPAFIVGNGWNWQQRALRELREALSVDEYLPIEKEVMRCPPGFAYAMSRRFQAAVREQGDGKYMVQPHTNPGQTLVLCGAGPSLREHAAKWCPRGDQVWGCNSAATWLAREGYPVTHAFTVDQTPHMCEEWRETPDLEYLLASTVHPHLTDLLLRAGRRVTFFHNYVGIDARPVEYCACGHDRDEHYPKGFINRAVWHPVYHLLLLARRLSSWGQRVSETLLRQARRWYQGRDHSWRLRGPWRRSVAPILAKASKVISSASSTISSVSWLNPHTTWLTVRIYSACRKCGKCAGYEPRRMDYEDWLYSTLYPGTIRAGSGLNAVTRAIDVALYMGFTWIVVLGADCAFRVHESLPPELKVGTPGWREWLDRATEMHADGGSAVASGATETTMDARIDGRRWFSKPDMIVTAVWLVKWRRKLEAARRAGEPVAKLTLIGDTLPNALRHKEDAFLDRLPGMADSAGNLLRLI